MLHLHLGQYLLDTAKGFRRVNLDTTTIDHIPSSRRNLMWKEPMYRVRIWENNVELIIHILLCNTVQWCAHRYNISR